MSIRAEAYPPPNTDGAAYQSWLRRHIAKLEARQADRIELVAAQKKALDESVEKAAREIDNLRTQQTIGVAK